jgi:hypothetical protein
LCNIIVVIPRLTVLEIIEKKGNYDPFVVDKGELPESDEELSLYMQLNYKPSIEIAEEEAINTIFDENHYVDRFHQQNVPQSSKS